jgi:hypothetical protein
MLGRATRSAATRPLASERHTTRPTGVERGERLRVVAVDKMHDAGDHYANFVGIDCGAVPANAATGCV